MGHLNQLNRVKEAKDHHVNLVQDLDLLAPDPHPVVPPDQAVPGLKPSLGSPVLLDSVLLVNLSTVGHASVKNGSHYHTKTIELKTLQYNIYM